MQTSRALSDWLWPSQDGGLFLDFLDFQQVVAMNAGRDSVPLSRPVDLLDRFNSTRQAAPDSWETSIGLRNLVGCKRRLGLWDRHPFRRRGQE